MSGWGMGEEVLIGGGADSDFFWILSMYMYDILVVSKWCLDEHNR